MNFKTVIIDDEPLAVEVVKRYCDALPEIDVLQCFNNAIEAMSFINANAVDLIFLDIEMPMLTGIELLETIKTDAKVIFTTAYPQFALDGFELDAIDYLIKPIPFKRFLRAVNKVKSANPNFKPAVVDEKAAETPIGNHYLFVKSDYESLKILVDDIQYIEGLRDYLKIHLNTGKFVLTLSNFKNILEKLPETNFMRVHNSYVVNISYISSLQKNRILIGKERLPISDTYRKAFFERIKI